MEIDVATISRWENGQTPRVQTLVLLAAALGTTITKLID
jgi:transcriptional regulator with XRE-family HTH domain